MKRKQFLYILVSLILMILGIIFMCCYFAEPIITFIVKLKFLIG